MPGSFQNGSLLPLVGITELLAKLNELLERKEQLGPTVPYDFDTPIDKVADALGSLTPEVALLQMTGSGSGEELEIGEQIAAIALPGGLIENHSSLPLDDIRGFDPIEVKEFVTNFIESLREQIPDGINEFVGNVIESLHEHAPDGIKEFVGHLIEFFGNDHPVSLEYPFEFDGIFEELAGDFGSQVPADKLLEVVDSRFGQDIAAAALLDELTNTDGFWLA